MAYATINKPNQYFDSTLYTGNGSSQSISNSGSFAVDFLIQKARSAATDNIVYDILRGSNYLVTNTTAADVASGIIALNSTGFNVGSGTAVNANGTTYVGWQWKANGAGVSNTSGSISSVVSANTTSGFSIVSWTGTGATATVGHGLGTAPSVIIPKNRTDAGTDWYTYWKVLGNTNAIRLNNTGASAATGIWNNTSPTSSVFSVIDNPVCNASGKSYVAYCFTEVKGFSKFGSYTGNGSADGTFIYTGFKPAYVLIKCTSNATDWFINDNKRLGYNGGNNVLYPDLSSAEATSPQLDLLSNGFKTRTVDSMINNSGYTYIYMAFAENPLVGTNGVPVTAR
jgi:hypothetical protein